MSAPTNIRRALRITERRHERDLELMRGVARRLRTVLACVADGTVTPEEATMSAEAWPMQGTHDPDEPVALVLAPWLVELYDAASCAALATMRLAPVMPELPRRALATWRGGAPAMGRPGR